MEILTLIYYLLLTIWYLSVIVLIIYLYENNYKPYSLKFHNRYYKELPSDLEPGEISMLVYHKIEPQVLTTVILKLIKKGAIQLHQENNNYYLKIVNAPGRIKLTRSETVILDFLKDISTQDELTLLELESYCGTKKGDSEFLFQYDLWKSILRRESSRKKFFEEKKGYEGVKVIRNIGILFLLVNIAGGYHLISGYGTILPVLFIPFFFYVAYRRTETYSEEYEKWLAFQDYLGHLKELGSENDIHNYIMSAIVLNRIDIMREYQPQDKSIAFAYRLNCVILKCYKFAYFNGNRSMKNLWSFK